MFFNFKYFSSWPAKPPVRVSLPLPSFGPDFFLSVNLSRLREQSKVSHAGFRYHGSYLMAEGQRQWRRNCITFHKLDFFSVSLVDLIMLPICRYLSGVDP